MMLYYGAVAYLVRMPKTCRRCSWRSLGTSARYLCCWRGIWKLLHEECAERRDAEEARRLERLAGGTVEERAMPLHHSLGTR